MKSTKQMKVAELRQALEARGLDSSGLKPALVARLQASLDHQDQCDQKVPSPASSTDEEQPPAEAEPEKNDKGSPPKASSNGEEVETDEVEPTANAGEEAGEGAEPAVKGAVAAEEAGAEAGADDNDGEETIPYMEPKPGGKAWRFVTNPDKLASPQVSAALTALVDKYGSLKAALAAGWHLVEKDGTTVSVTKTSGPHYMVPPGGGPDDILTSGQALGAIARAPMPTNTAKRARSM